MMQDDVLRQADEYLEIAHHAVRMLRNSEYVQALDRGIEETGRPGEELLAKYL